MTLKPSLSSLRMVAAGGGAAAAKKCTVLGSGFFSSSVALMRKPMTVGAPPICVTPYFAIASKMFLAVTRRRHTCVPAMTLIDQVKHQPLQWNIGTVQR